MSTDILNQFCCGPSGTEDSYLADSQFDFPHCSTGWQYLTLDKENNFGAWRACESSKETATPLAFLVNEDPHCRLGRDFVHVGYSIRPTLQWHAKAAGDYVVEGEMSLARPSAHGKMLVWVYVNDVCEVSAQIDYPELLSFSVPARLAPGDFVRIVFGVAKYIDNNHCLYYVRVRSVQSPPAMRVVRTDCAPAWSILERAIGETIGGRLDEDELHHFSRMLFNSTDRHDPKVASAALVVHNDLFGSALKNFRQPRMFAAPANTPQANPVIRGIPKEQNG